MYKYKTLAMSLHMYLPGVILIFLLSFICNCFRIWSHASCPSASLYGTSSPGVLLTLKLEYLRGAIISVLYWSGLTSLQTKSINLKRKRHCSSKVTINSLRSRSRKHVANAWAGENCSVFFVCFGSFHSQLNISLLNILCFILLYRVLQITLYTVCFILHLSTVRQIQIIVILEKCDNFI